MIRLIAEFEEQSFTQIIFPHKNSDWIEYLNEAETTFINIINAVISFQTCLVICADKKYVQTLFSKHKNLHFVEYETDDTWARDSSAISIQENDSIKLLDFKFTAWGGKFEASKDDKMSRFLSKYYSVEMLNTEYTLEGGAIESNANGVILTTSACMNNPNRNANLNATQRDAKLRALFNAREVLYLHHGYLAGDDTDSHIDTLARFISPNAIMYIRCEDRDDEHYRELYLMEKELQKIAQKHKYKLIALPMPSALYYENERLPATYANFLFVNGAVLVPSYGVKEDKEALNIFKETFKERKILNIDCSVLIRQHGSLHCVSMNFAKDIKIIYPK